MLAGADADTAAAALLLEEEAPEEGEGEGEEAGGFPADEEGSEEEDDEDEDEDGALARLVADAPPPPPPPVTAQDAAAAPARPATPVLAMVGPTPAETFYLRPPTFAANMPHTVCFAAPLLQKCWAGAGDTKHYTPQTRPKLFVKQGSLANNAVRAAFKNAGYRKTKGDAYHTLWAGALKSDQYRNLAVWQTTNHFPGTWELGRKDRLWLNLARAKRSNPQAYDFFAKSFLLPHDSNEWRDEYKLADGKAMWIIKPVASSRGRGIRLVRNPRDVNVDREIMVQRYLKDPHLISGFKYDLRVYALITCFDPLRVYVFHEGLVRFATLPYTTSAAGKAQRCVHLTNYSINSKQEGFTCGEENDDEGFKWTISALRAHFDSEEGKGSFGPIWEQICDNIAKTCIAVEPKFNTLLKLHVPNPNTAYEIFGFDFLIAASKPSKNGSPPQGKKVYLIEVNTGPALMTPTPLDKRVKFPLVADMLHVVGLQATDRAAANQVEEAKRRERLTGIAAAAVGPKMARSTSVGRLRPGSREQTPGSRPGTAARFRSLNDARDAEFHDISHEELPACVRELEEELGRVSETGWRPVFPLASDPERHSELFDTPRFANIMLQRWLLHKAGKLPPRPPSPLSRPGSRASLGSRAATPSGQRSRVGSASRDPVAPAMRIVRDPTVASRESSVATRAVRNPTTGRARPSQPTPSPQAAMAMRLKTPPEAFRDAFASAPATYTLEPAPAAPAGRNQPARTAAPEKPPPPRPAAPEPQPELQSLTPQLTEISRDFELRRQRPLAARQTRGPHAAPSRPTEPHPHSPPSADAGLPHGGAASALRTRLDRERVHRQVGIQEAGQVAAAAAAALRSVPGGPVVHGATGFVPASLGVPSGAAPRHPRHPAAPAAPRARAPSTLLDGGPKLTPSDMREALRARIAEALRSRA